MINSILRRIPLFSTLPPAELDALVASLSEKTYPAQSVLIQEGERGDKFYIVLDGQIAILKAMGSDDERLLGLRGVGEFIGEMSLLNRDGLRTASARVHTDARVLEMTRANFDALLTRVPTIAYEMLRVLSARLDEAHNNAIAELMERNRELAEAYAELQAAQEQIIEKEILDRELVQAKEIQESMLPKTLPSLERFEIGARMVPARMIGGDFFDIFSLDSDSLGIAVGDVSGKGIPAALFMALTTRLLKAEARPGVSPEKTLLRVNQHLLEMNTRGMFVTLLYGVLNQKTREIVCVRAGHEYPLMWDDDRRPIQIAHDRGNPLGIFHSPLLDIQKFTLPQGSTLLLYSDGVTEAYNEEEELFGVECIEAIVPDLLKNSAQKICNLILERLNVYHGDLPQSDDITVLTLKAIA